MTAKNAGKTELSADSERFAKNMQILETAREQLKQEFIGLDTIIDEIVRQMSCWFVFPELQERPYIINLWGMTGVGKTALIKRLVELIGCTKGFASFDLGRGGTMGIDFHDLERIAWFERKIIALDEFQHARTINERGEEEQMFSNRLIWDLLDSGVVRTFYMRGGIGDLEELYHTLSGLIRNGIKAKKGKVTAGIKLAEKELFSRRYRDSSAGKGLHLVPDEYLQSFLRVRSREHNFKLTHDVRAVLNRFDEVETLRFIKDILDQFSGQNELDLSNLLIFVMGNIDEAYTLSSDFNSEIDADVFYRKSLEINLLQVKEALKRRFRAEQIARLGNNHVIYPSISHESYQKIIDLELARITRRFREEKGLVLEFDQSMKELIYDEGVFPTQGVRPLISTLNQLIKANLGQIYGYLHASGVASDRIRFTATRKQITCRYFCGGKELFARSIPTTLSKIVKETPVPDDMQAIIAVHESGHAIVRAILEGKVPKEIIARSAMPGAMGYTYYEGSNREPTSLSAMISEASCFLGGYAAERLIFGSKNLTDGSGRDIARATETVYSAVHECGMGRDKATLAMNPERTNVIHDVSETEAKVKSILKKACCRAARLLQREKRLLLELATFLSTNQSMKGEMFLNDFFIRYATPEGLASYNKQRLSYREKLQELAEEARRVAALPQPGQLLIECENAEVLTLSA
ncbi:MAG: hypothetical protein GX569_06035 [Candidatus Riflebacteria bacterium]|nr:hypothetical protein [Candidatus Riflebacteria bacterium]